MHLRKPDSYQTESQKTDANINKQIGQQIIFKNERPPESSSCPSGLRDESDKVSASEAAGERRVEHAEQQHL